jgi:hypothetical protein
MISGVKGFWKNRPKFDSRSLIQLCPYFIYWTRVSFRALFFFINEREIPSLDATLKGRRQVVEGFYERVYFPMK